jgi:hypothetical protein
MVKSRSREAEEFLCSFLVPPMLHPDSNTWPS